MAAPKKKVTEEKLLEELVADEVVEEVVSEANAEDILSEINESVSSIAGEEKVLAKDVPTKTFGPTDKIQTKSLFFGELNYVSPINGATYVWKDYGSTCFLPYNELEVMGNTKPTYLFKPYLVLNDADAVRTFNLTSTYESVAQVNRLEALFATCDLTKIRKVINGAIAVNQRDVVISKVRKLREENKLVNINILKLLNEILKIDLA